MRPLGLKNGTLHIDYDSQFGFLPDLMTGVVVFTGTDKEAEKSCVYEFFRNNYIWAFGKTVPPLTEGDPPAVVGDCTPNPFNLKARNRVGQGPRLVVQPYIQRYKSGNGQQKVRIILDCDVAAELVRIAFEDEWNETEKFPQVQCTDEIIAALRKAIGLVKDPPAHAAQYGRAREDLLTICGGFCAYCEGKCQDGGDLDVEHRLPKSWFPTETLRWDNLLLACKRCNSRCKGDKPSRHHGILLVKKGNPSRYESYRIENKAPLEADVPQVTQKANPSKRTTQPDTSHDEGPTKQVILGGITQKVQKVDPSKKIVESDTLDVKSRSKVGGRQRMPYHDILAAASDSMLWPDVDDPETLTPLSFRMIGYELWGGRPGEAMSKLEDNLALHTLTGHNQCTTPDQTLQADVYSPNDKKATRMCVQVRAAARKITTDDPSDAAQKRIKRINEGAQSSVRTLKLRGPSGETRDQRMIARTEAWFKALRMYEALSRGLQELDEVRGNKQSRSEVSTEAQHDPGRVVQEKLNALIKENLALVWRQALEGAEGGFYSVWVTVFKRAGSEAMAIDLVRKLASRAQADPFKHSCYHGTDIDASVLPFLKDL